MQTELKLVRSHPHSIVNPHMLVIAREYRGVTQKALAETVGVTQQAIQRFESGNLSVLGSDKFSAVCDALDLPKEFFAIDDVRLGFGTSAYFNRKRITSARERDYVSGLVNILRVHTKLMLQEVDIEFNHSVPDYRGHDMNPVVAANAVRNAWNVPDGPIENMTRLLERAGVLIIECDFGTKSIDGTELSVNSLPHLIFINKGLPPDRYRFTLAHELAHIVLHNNCPNEKMEDEADAFASEFLMNSPSFNSTVSVNSVGKPKLDHLIQLKPYWKVSIESMIMRMRDIGKINKDDVTTYYKEMGYRRLRNNEPQPFPKEKPVAFKMICENALSTWETPEKSAESLLKIKPRLFKEIYGVYFEKPEVKPKRPALRLVSVRA